MTRYLIDLHCHTQEKSYDGKVPAAAIVTKLIQLGFSGVVFTDHNNVWSTAELEELRKQSAAPPEFLLLSGQEVRTSIGELMCGDVLVYGPTQSIPDGTQITEVLALAKQAGGHCIAAHPGVSMIGLGGKIGDFPLLAAESWNGRYGATVAAESQRLCEEIGLPSIGGSDCHSEKEIGGGGTVFFNLPQTWEQIAAQILNRETCIYKPPITQRIKRWFAGNDD
jgi:3',5'-nucleoside bisphosphate phosphatase